MCPIPNGFWDRAISLYSSLDLEPNIVLPSSMWIGVKRQLAVVTVDSDIVGVLWKMPHIFTNAEYADMLYAACCILSSHELQSALMLTVEFSKMYYTMNLSCLGLELTVEFPTLVLSTIHNFTKNYWR
jgi:hypothetical protein